MSQETSKKGQKRKSIAEAGPSSNVNVIAPTPGVGPVFVNFPSIKPSKHTPFTLYTRDPGSNKDLASQHTIIAGETEDVEFFSTNRDRQGGSEGGDCQYLPAIYNPETNQLEIYGSSPLYLLGHRVKRLRNAELSTQSSRAADYKAKRNTLGETFGTKKAKSQIKAEERNKVDVGAMAGIKGHLMEAIGEAEEVGEVVISDLIPRPDLETTEASLVYPRESLITDAEWSAIDASGLIKAKDDRARAAMLPWRRSRYVEDKMRVAVGSGQTTALKKSTVRMAYYLASLLALYDLAPRLAKLNKAEIAAKLPGIPNQLLDGLLERFTETAGKRNMVTEKTKTKLLAYICVTYLHLDDFNAEVGRIAKELGLPQAKLQDVFKSLGCKVDVPTPAERERLGISLADARSNRRAMLKAPVQFPKQRTRAPARR